MVFSCPPFLRLSFPLLSLSSSKMHSVTFVSVFVALFALLSVAHPIRHLGHGHRILKVRENKRAGNPLVVSSINADLPASASTPVSNGVPSDIPKSDAESSIPIVKSSATSTKSDDQDSKPTQSPSTDGDGSLTHKLFPYGFGERPGPLPRELTVLVRCLMPR